jgi:hypothetical protein
LRSRIGHARLARCRGAVQRHKKLPPAGGAPAEPDVERGGAHQGAGDPGDDQRRVGGAEPVGEGVGEAGVAGGVPACGLGEVLGEVEEGAENADDLADGAGRGGLPIRGGIGEGG